MNPKLNVSKRFYHHIEFCDEWGCVWFVLSMSSVLLNRSLQGRVTQWLEAVCALQSNAWSTGDIWVCCQRGWTPDKLLIVNYSPNASYKWIILTDVKRGWGGMTNKLNEVDCQYLFAWEIEHGNLPKSLMMLMLWHCKAELSIKLHI